MPEIPIERTADSSPHSTDKPDCDSAGVHTIDLTGVTPAVSEETINAVKEKAEHELLHQLSTAAIESGADLGKPSCLSPVCGFKSPEMEAAYSAFHSPTVLRGHQMYAPVNALYLGIRIVNLLSGNNYLEASPLAIISMSFVGVVAILSASCCVHFSGQVIKLHESFGQITNVIFLLSLAAWVAQLVDTLYVNTDWDTDTDGLTRQKARIFHCGYYVSMVSSLGPTFCVVMLRIPVHYCSAGLMLCGLIAVCSPYADGTDIASFLVFPLVQVLIFLSFENAFRTTYMSEMRSVKMATRIYETEQRQLQMDLELHQAREMGHDSLLKMLSHDFKGTVLNLESHLAQVDGFGHLAAQLSHIVHSIMSIKYRCATVPLKLGGQSTALKPLFAKLAILFPEIEFQGLEIECTVEIVPCLLHLALHQLFRNARVHGGGGCTCTVTIEADCVVISTRNKPGSNHERLVEAGSQAMALALSGSVGTVSSSGLGLKDISRVLKLCNSDFSIKWREADVLAQIRLLIAMKPACVSTDTEGVAVRVCVLDDQLGARMTGLKLIKMIHPNYTAPCKLKSIDAVWEDSLVKVAGATYDEVQECIQWSNQAESSLRTIVLLDRMLEFPGCVLDGLDLISEFAARGAVVVVRSGNDSDEDKQLYLERGAFGSIDKVLHSGNTASYVLEQAKQRIVEQVNEYQNNLAERTRRPTSPNLARKVQQQL